MKICLKLPPILPLAMLASLLMACQVTLAALTATFEQKLSDAAGVAYDYFGNTVAISADGSTAIVGVALDDAGSLENAGRVFVFTRSGSVWSQQAILTATGALAGDTFGTAVALSANGSTALIGAAGVQEGRGAAYVFTRSGSTWSQQAKLTAADAAISDSLGSSVALSADGGTAIAGAPAYQAGGVTAGAAYVFTRSGTAWSQHTKLTATDAAAEDSFGYAVTLTSDGLRAIVGAPRDDHTATNNAGSAYAFMRSGGGWTQEAKLVDISVSGKGTFFGAVAALSADGATALIGKQFGRSTTNISSGTATIFTRTGSAWSALVRLEPPSPVVNDWFGNSVSLSADGTRALVGSVQKDILPNDNKGVAFLFSHNGSAWALQTTLTAPDGGNVDYFGASLALTAAGDRAFVGASNDDIGDQSDTGSAYAFTIGAAPPPGFTTWADAAGLLGADRDLAANPAKDGVSNLLKFAFNLTAAAADLRVLAAGSGTAGLPVIGTTGSAFRVEYLRRIGSGLIYTPFKNSALTGTWTVMTGTPLVTGIDANWERVVVQDSYDPLVTPRLFGKVQVTAP